MKLEEKKIAAAEWFRDLRDQICAEFEAIEREYAASVGDATDGGVPSPSGGRLGWGLDETPLLPPSPHPTLSRRERASTAHAAQSEARFTRTPWQRPEGGSGEISIMKGRVFEKVGVNISIVHGEFSEQFRAEIPGASENPKFWAAGISLVAHMASPLVPAAHFNTRMIVVGDGVTSGESPRPVTPGSSRGPAQPHDRIPGQARDDKPVQHEPIRLWFGGGGDLNPMVENAADTADFHGAFKQACDQSQPEFYDAFKKWCDEYFYIPHRNEARGVGGIFYDYLGLNKFGADTSPVTSGRFGKGGLTKEATLAGMQLAANTTLDWDGAFGFTQNVGRAFADIYPALIRRHMLKSWTPEQRHHQLVKRGRYAEYNLLYDRGTRFGLMTGGNPDAILMSLPPVAIWE